MTTWKSLVSFRFGAPLAVAVLLFGCSESTPTGPEPAPVAADSTVIRFSSPDATFSTTDVRDVDDQIVRFDAADDTLIWTPDNRTFPNWTVNGNILAGRFEVRFGTVNGEPRAYFTEIGPGTLCDLSVDAGGQLEIVPTNNLPPQN